MNKFKKLEELLIKWKAVQENFYHDCTHYTPKSIDSFVKALEMAIKYAKQPSNTQLKLDGLKCEVCNGINIHKATCSAGFGAIIPPTT